MVSSYILINIFWVILNIGSVVSTENPGLGLKKMIAKSYGHYYIPYL
jgi:hypothetical protein